MPSTFASLQRHAGEFAPPGVEPHHSPDLTLEPKHLDLDVHIDVDRRRVSGTVTHTVIARTEGATELLLHGVDLEIAQVEDPDGHALSWGYDGRELAIDWADGVPRGAERRVAVTWSVVRPVTGIDFSGPTETTPDRERWAATDHETERARHWLPCLDHLAVRTTLDLRIRSASDLTILANGLLVAREDHGDGTATAVWRLEQPCPAYLLCIAIGDFVRVDGGTVEGREIAAFAPRSYGAEPLERSFGPTAGMMEWMQKRLRTPFPYPKYYQFAVPGIGGAMENISLVSWDAIFLADEALRAEWGWLIDLINLHEMAHSYFGDAVVCADFSHTWLKESWATYMESVWLGDVEGTDAMAFQLHEERVAYFEEADTKYARPIVTRDFASSWDMYDRHLYPGGAVRLHMLRRLLGEDDFWTGVATYLDRHSGGVAETDDFRRILEAQSGRSLTRFFDQWLRSPGYPKLEATFKYSQRKGEAEIVIEQTQVDADKGIGLFDLQLPLAVEAADGSWVRRTFDASRARQVLVLPLAQRPRQVVLDPDGDLVFGLAFDPGADLLRHQLVEGPTLAARIQAAVLLGKKVNPRTAIALQAAFAAADHWGLQIVIARSLGGAGTLAAAEALAALLEVAEDDRVLAELATACGRMREPVLADALRRFLARETRPHRATWAALCSLGKQAASDANRELLTAFANTDTWGEWAKRGAVDGLGSDGSPEALTELERHLQHGTGGARTRAAAAAALGRGGRRAEVPQKHAALAALCDLTRDPDYTVRLAAVSALATLGEAAGAEAMEATIATVAAQDEPRIRRDLKRLRGTGGARVAKLEERVEELTDRLRKANARLDRIEGKARAGDAS